MRLVDNITQRCKFLNHLSTIKNKQTIRYRYNVFCAILKYDVLRSALGTFFVLSDIPQRLKKEDSFTKPNPLGLIKVYGNTM